MKVSSIDGAAPASDRVQPPLAATRGAWTALSRSSQVLRRLVFSLVLAAPLTPAAAQELRWVRQMGTTTEDIATGVAVDRDGNAYITGYTGGELGGPSLGWPGGADAVLAKYDPSGTRLWIRQIGTAVEDYATAIAVDRQGNVYITGWTSDDLGGIVQRPEHIFLSKYDSSGVQRWTRESYTARGARPYSLTIDAAGTLYAAGIIATNPEEPNPMGRTYDGFLARYDSAGSPVWIRQLGSDRGVDDVALGVAADGEGNALITGFTWGSLGGTSAGGSDAFLAKYDASGSRLWIRQVGWEGYDVSEGVAVDQAGNSFIAGVTSGFDVFLAKHDPAGNELWLRTFGDPIASDWAKGVAVDASGDVWITGVTGGALGGPSAGGADLFVAKCDTTGNTIWLRQSGTAPHEEPYAIAVDASGNAYIAGSTTGSFGGPHAGGAGYWDIFLAKYGPVPACSPADTAGGGTTGNEPDGTVDGTDFIAFINSFAIGDAAVDPLADIAGGGDTGLEPDGTIDGTDFIFFINAFAIGC